MPFVSCHHYFDIAHMVGIIFTFDIMLFSSRYRLAFHIDALSLFAFMLCDDIPDERRDWQRYVIRWRPAPCASHGAMMPAKRQIRRTAPPDVFAACDAHTRQTHFR